ncbi:MAG: hypothetical protein LBR11_07900 [Deltaproteobacteria bacterium]|jgi:hypothetical protein|nr:hypothetical protein [Deltaproteobacteria bacterium]
MIGQLEKIAALSDCVSPVTSALDPARSAFRQRLIAAGAENCPVSKSPGSDSRNTLGRKKNIVSTAPSLKIAKNLGDRSPTEAGRVRPGERAGTKGGVRLKPG